MKLELYATFLLPVFQFVARPPVAHGVYESSQPRELLPQLLSFNGLFSRTTWVSRYQKGKTSLHLNEARDDGVLGCSGISWTICKQSAPHSRQITTSTPHHSMFTGRMLLLTPNQLCQSSEGNPENNRGVGNVLLPASRPRDRDTSSASRLHRDSCQMCTLFVPKYTDQSPVHIA